jgi:hypothetical protein
VFENDHQTKTKTKTNNFLPLFTHYQYGKQIKGKEKKKKLCQNVIEKRKCKKGNLNRANMF